MKAELEEAFERLLAEPGVVFLLGGLDSGKTTFGVELLRRANEAGIPSALVDADVGQSTTGPPTTVGLRFCDDLPAVDRGALQAADGLAFVGSYSPRLHLLPLVAGTAKLTGRARAAGCRLIVVDTTGLVSGIYGQMLKFSKMDLVAPDWVVAFRRGGELEPILGIAERFTPASVVEIDVAGAIEERSVEERMSFREKQFASYFAEGTLRWRIKPSVFMPTLPPEFDLALLDSLVVGMEDGKGSCVGIGVLEYDQAERALRMLSPVAEGVRGLRLGSVKIDISGRSKGPVDIRQLFGSE
jgi:polynucleotide 5'-kinase involved in rRNA processing